MSAPRRTGSEKEIRREMVSIARDILNGAVGIVAGARKIASMRFGSATENDKDVLVFVGIDSESDDLPIGDVRRHWNSEALKAKDAELRSFEARVKESAFRACERIIARYG
jgi:hypothetical protein